jgi:FtsZ-binding cell division protein ZapB
LDQDNTRGGRIENIGGAEMRTNLELIKRPENKTPREDLLLMDVTQMFWELRELREEVKALRRENHNYELSKSMLKKYNEKLKYENELLKLSNMHK